MKGWNELRRGIGEATDPLRPLLFWLWIGVVALFIGTIWCQGPLWLLLGSAIMTYLPVIARIDWTAKPAPAPDPAIEPERGEFRCAACNHREPVGQPMSEITGWFLDDHQTEMSSTCGTKRVMLYWGDRAARCPRCRRITHWTEPEDV
jgi:hypothetical protein